MILFGQHAEQLAELVRQLRLKFTMKDLGHAQHILGMKITRHREKRQLFLSKANYIRPILEPFNMQAARSTSTPLPAKLRLSQTYCPTSGPEGDNMKSVLYTLVVGSLMYAMVVTQPIIAHAVGVVSRYMHNLDRPHWTAMKNIFRYLVGTKDHGILDNTKPQA